MGAERRSIVMPEEERRNTAYHESGHAVVAKLLPKTDPVHKVTIIPRGRALGVTMQLPEQDRYSMDRNRMLNVIAVLFGGRIAEELFMNQMTTGASNDFERATRDRAQHGHALRHVRRAGSDGLRRERGRDLPRPLDHDAEERVGSDDAEGRRARSARSSTSSMPSRGACSRTTATRSRRWRRRCSSWRRSTPTRSTTSWPGKPPRPPKPTHVAVRTVARAGDAERRTPRRRPIRRKRRRLDATGRAKCTPS